MRTETCDRCGAEIMPGTNGTVTIASDRQNGPDGGSWDACQKCREELAAQFKTRPRGEIDPRELAERCKAGDAEAIEQWNALSLIPWGAEAVDVEDTVIGTVRVGVEDAEAGS
jgi:ribosomal protein L24E